MQHALYTHPVIMCWLSGEKATDKTHELWPEMVAARFPCCLEQRTHHVRRLNVCVCHLHVVNLHILIIWSGHQKLRVWRETQRPHRHTMSCGDNDIFNVLIIADNDAERFLPSRVWSNFSDSRSNKLMIPSTAPQAMNLPSGLCVYYIITLSTV